MENNQRLWNKESVPFIVNRINQLISAGFTDVEAGEKIFREDLSIIEGFNNQDKSPKSPKALTLVYRWVMSTQPVQSLKSSHLKSGMQYKLLARQSGISVPDFTA